ncbi:MAG: nucleoside monophosphate kinase [Candidatus Nomurabacteria bacterium]|jgi:adenylate kinase|nr:nucleoside monophosphate kinase [Candidatus Nomurabacteria bacterium]
MILFYGPAGSGKSTQGKILAKKFNWQYVSAGDLLREKAKNDVMLAKIMDKGDLAPSGVINELIFTAVDPTDKGHVVVDGYPRELEELADLVERYGVNTIAAAIVLVLPETEAIKRLKLRAREDDDDDAIQRRLEIYHEEMAPILNFFDEHSVKIIKIDGAPSIKEIAKNIEKELNKWQIL